MLTGCMSGKTGEEPQKKVTVEPLPVPAIKKPKELKRDYNPENLQYELVWSDEFDYTGKPDPKKWSYDVGGGGWGNNELQYYTAGDNVTVENGKMIITARKEEKEKMHYTSTRLVTKGKGDWKYGRIEVCAKLPYGRGTWPAIWMLPTGSANGWPGGGEIDIMEHVGYDMNVIHGTVHTKAYNHNIGTSKGDSIKVSNVSEGFHVYAIEWLPDKMKFLVDGKQYYEFDPYKYSTVVTGEQWPFDNPFHLLINIAVGGGWGGAKGVDEAIFPQTLEVDYVRVYQVTKGF